jgi:predicted dithiol-disulfide oxidoreductase (DUF899 family)
MAISRAPLQKLDAFKARMGWTFDRLSSAGNDFNYDYAVSFTPEQIKSGAKTYNFGTSGFGNEDAPGISVFSAMRPATSSTPIRVSRAAST